MLRQSDGVSYGKVTIRARADLKNTFMGAAQAVIAGDSALRCYYDKMRADGLDFSAAQKMWLERLRLSRWR